MSWLTDHFHEFEPEIISKFFKKQKEEIEHWPKKKILEYQTEAVKEIVQHAYKNNPFYKKKLEERKIIPSDTKGLEDIERIPFTTKDELRGKPWILLSVPRREISQVHVSTGTTGGEHTYILYTWEDLFIRDLAPAMPHLVPVEEDDVVINALPYEMSSAGLSFHRVFQDGTGAMVVPTGKGGAYSTPEKTIKIAKDLGTTIIITTPSYAVYLAEVAESIGIKPGEDIKPRFMWLTGEGCSFSFRDRVESIWKCPAYFYYGSLECGPLGIECSEKEGYHIPKAHVYVEIVDKEDQHRLDFGEIGEIVVTVLLRKATPLIRFRTGDLGYIDDIPCPCGIEWERLYLRGRKEDQIYIGGKEYSPFYIEEFLMRIPEVSCWYQFIVRDEVLLIQVEAAKDIVPSEKIGEMISSKIEYAVDVPNKVEFVANLPRPSGKLVRVIDQRTNKEVNR